MSLPVSLSPPPHLISSFLSLLLDLGHLISRSMIALWNTFSQIRSQFIGFGCWEMDIAFWGHHSMHPSIPFHPFHGPPKWNQITFFETAKVLLCCEYLVCAVITYSLSYSFRPSTWTASFFVSMILDLRIVKTLWNFFSWMWWCLNDYFLLPWEVL